MAGGLLATAFGLGKRLPVPARLRRLAGPLIRKSADLSPVARAAAIGASTPLLPCASLYGVFLAAVAASSLAGGAALMLAFAAGATPALAFVQLHAPLLSRFPRVALWLRRLMPVAAAVMLVWRASQGGGDASAPPACH
jgi:sulfite exporter TauE/SafE